VFRINNFLESKWASYGEPYNYTLRANNTPVILDETLIKSGDYFAIMNFEVMDVLIRLGTGGQTGHTAVALWIDGQLFICESKGKGTQNWPPPYGVISTPYRQWMQQAVQADYQIAFLQLRDEYRALFDEQKAINWFNSVQGTPYGYHNFIFGWIDTESDNYPPPLQPQNLLVAFLLVNDLYKPLADKMYNEALNFRLSTSGLDLHQILQVADSKNITFWELMTVPEQDNWKYSDGYSMVCDVFVLRMYEEAGIFGDLDMEMTEFSPKDGYQIRLFVDDISQRPAECHDDPFPYCQLMGDLNLYLPGFNMIQPYTNMNQKCGGYLPYYKNITKTC